MNVKILCAIGLLAALSAIGGCASMKGDSRSVAVNALESDNVDLAYVARIEQQARERNTEVQWVHPPTLGERH